MKQILNLSIAILFLSFCATSYSASDKTSVKMDESASTAVPSNVEMAIRSTFKLSRPNIAIETIAPSVIKNIFEVKVAGGPTLYTSANGQFFVLGDIYAVEPGGFVNLAEQSREGDRMSLLADVRVEDMIVFSPEQLPAKATLTVFTDVDCFYCQKLHKEVPDLNRIGIEVRYLAYPRAGIGSDAYKKIASAWCADNKQESLTKLKNRQYIPTNVCAGNPVEDQYNLGQKMGVTGTPALVTSTGRLMPGYIPTLRLASVLGVDVDPIIAAELQQKEDAAAKK
ncbi:MAG: thiol:disulfide interchange protein DsbC [Gammaproteobacteria bacterium]|jgi:thiol:disulfide interchange protein DsbC